MPGALCSKNIYEHMPFSLTIKFDGCNANLAYAHKAQRGNMPRPRKCRKVNTTPDVTYFKPRGVPMRDLAEVYLPLDGFEAIRLADLEGFSHEAAANQMHVSRQTFGRILAAAHQTVAKALVSGMALRIHGGDYRLAERSTGGDENKDKNPRSKETGGPVETSVSATPYGQPNVPPNVPNDQEEIPPMKKIAISSEGPTLEDQVDPRFGRAAGFIIIDPETMDFEYQDNGASQARAQGAGIQAAETVVSAGAEAVLTGYVGPKAFQALAATGIRVAQNLENLSVKEAVERFQKNEVDWATPEQAKGFGK